ncbi:hypothetical protein BDZ89DRAFT_1136929 [Hymenopellis radicata]|nr:hypothetical protein BDZ89DRAFT_1136929 [Hymenopellis radicata]
MPAKFKPALTHYRSVPPLEPIDTLIVLTSDDEEERNKEESSESDSDNSFPSPYHEERLICEADREFERQVEEEADRLMMANLAEDSVGPSSTKAEEVYVIWDGELMGIFNSRADVEHAGYKNMQHFTSRESAVRLWDKMWENGKIDGSKLVYLVICGIDPADGNSASAVKMASGSDERQVMVARDPDLGWAVLNDHARRGLLKFI